jgi:hypothetical protein
VAGAGRGGSGGVGAAHLLPQLIRMADHRRLSRGR